MGSLSVKGRSVDAGPLTTPREEGQDQVGASASLPPAMEFNGDGVGKHERTPCKGLGARGELCFNFQHRNEPGSLRGRWGWG